MNMDTRRKIVFYLNPERNEADRWVCDEMDRLPQKERGQVSRATMLAGFALRKQDIRLPNVLAELLNAGTTFADIAQVMRAVFPDDMARMGWGDPDGQARGTAAQQEKPAEVRDETRENAMKMFGQPAGAGERKE